MFTHLIANPVCLAGCLYWMYHHIPLLPWILQKFVYLGYFVAAEFIYQKQMLTHRLPFVKNFLGLTDKMIKEKKRCFVMLQKMQMVILADLRSKAKMK